MYDYPNNLKIEIWNPERKNGYECKVDGVRNTSYMEVHNLIGTSGCSRTPEMWDWAVMGILEKDNGKFVVCPGDYILTTEIGKFVLTPSEYKIFIEEWKND